MGRGYRFVTIWPTWRLTIRRRSTGAGRCGSGSVGGWPGGFEPVPGGSSVEGMDGAGRGLIVKVSTMS